MCYIIDLNGRDLDKSIGSGFSFGVKIKGFWSSDSIHVYINRSMFSQFGYHYGLEVH